MGRTALGSHQPLRRFAPPPHKWGGQLPVHISPSGASRPLPINGEDSPRFTSAPLGLRATSPRMGRTALGSHQPLRRFAPPPHECGGHPPPYPSRPPTIPHPPHDVPSAPPPPPPPPPSSPS